MIVEQITTQTTIETPRFVMRPLRVSDAGLIAQHCNDPRVAEATTQMPHPFPPGGAEALIDRAQRPDRSEDVWAIDGSHGGHSEVMGLVYLTGMDRQQDEVRYWVAPGFWNSGIASEAVRALIEANPHKAGLIFAEVMQTNPASARVLTNCGFEYIGDAETYCVAKEALVPTWTYSLKLGT